MKIGFIFFLGFCTIAILRARKRNKQFQFVEQLPIVATAPFLLRFTMLYYYKKLKEVWICQESFPKRRRLRAATANRAGRSTRS